MTNRKLCGDNVNKNNVNTKIKPKLAVSPILQNVIIKHVLLSLTFGFAFHLWFGVVSQFV